MKIEIESRESITTRAKEPFRLRTALISITDADDDFAVLEHKPCHILQLKFDDVSSEIFEEALGRTPTKEEAVMLSKKFHMFTDKQALEIAEFFMSILGKVELLICQCEYGQSRSAGVAAAIMQFKSSNGIEVFADENYFPNRFVYNKLLKVLRYANKASYEEKYTLKHNILFDDKVRENPYIKPFFDINDIIGNDNIIYESDAVRFIQGITENGMIFTREARFAEYDNYDTLCNDYWSSTIEIWLTDEETEYDNNYMEMCFNENTTMAVAFYNLHRETNREDLVRIFAKDGEWIKSFRDEYRFLSNFYQHPFEYKGLIYPNAESAFQAQKCSTDEERIKYTTQKNPVRAKQMGRKEPNLPKDWNIISSDIMEGVLRAKFAVPELSKMLTDTYRFHIEEGNKWHDNYWGNCNCDKCKKIIGKNMLGKLLMKIRADLIREAAK